MKLRIVALCTLLASANALSGSGSGSGGSNLGTPGSKRSALAVVAGASQSSSSSDGSSDVPTSVFNLAKTILGAGVLSLPSGVAAFSDQKSGLVPASALLLAMGIISAYSFASIGRACRLHDTRGFSDAWAKSVGPSTAGIISSVITFKTFFACLAYSIIIGDSFTSLFKSFGFPGVSRSQVILGLSSLVIFPLCMLKNMDALKTTSILGLGGIAYCALFMTVRLFDGSYRVGGKYFADLAAAVRPSFGARTSAPQPHVIFVLISMISTAYVAHYNAPKFWVELKNKTEARYKTVVASAFGFAFAMYMTVMWTGFLTFGGHSTGFVLNNYSSKDKFATFARLCIGLAILFGYPLTFSALREGAFDLLRVPAAGTGVNGNDGGNRRAKLATPATVILMSLITALALVLKNVGIVVSFSGALIGAMLIYTVPAIMNISDLRAAKKSGGKGKSSSTYTKQQQLELAANYGMALMGCVIAVIGVATTLIGASAH